ncbi:AraC family transcriptional regulator [Motilimonas cestriensis]|uniref:AraC family transcriptional regulator n=1 Tax=Motilimonas cestriensis TaxID=2742685 RepID=A0ABS8WA21_9GAMM|nr:AraC family transcriptional regulator [Motilimonas cestriensis]MCE2595330.1 AraC family transcriptional regulator [Motilimonas cestriensis]
MKPYIEKMCGDHTRPWRVMHYQCTESHFDWHYHLEYEIVLKRDCAGKLFVGDAILPFSHNTLALFGPHLPHTNTIDSLLNEASHNDTYVLWFSGQWINSLIKLLPEYQGIQRMLQRSNQGLLFCQEAAQQVYQHLQSHRQLSPLQQVNNVLAILAIMAEAPEQKSITSSSQPYVEETEKQHTKLNKATAFIEQHYHTQILVDDLCQHLHMSKSSVYRMFEKHFNNSFSVHLAQYRIGKACEQLINKNLAIAAIANRVGFNNLANFNRQFKLYKGMKPSEFRRQFSQRKA